MGELDLLSNQQNTTFANLNDLPVFKTANEFSIHIEKLAVSKRLTHLEAILDFCKEHMIEPDEIASKVSKSLKAKLEQDFRELNYLPKQAQIDM